MTFTYFIVHFVMLIAVFITEMVIVHKCVIIIIIIIVIIRYFYGSRVSNDVIILVTVKPQIEMVNLSEV